MPQLRVPQELVRSATIGFIGLGAMGNHMLNNLVTRSVVEGSMSRFNFALFDVNDNAVRSVIERHRVQNPTVRLLRCSSPSEVAMNASTIISMVPTSQHVKDVYLGKESVFDALQKLDVQSRRDTLCMDQSTIDQSASREVALKIRETGAEMIDAPVSRGVVGAQNGTLSIMVGGNESAFHRALPVLQAMGTKVTYCGDLGAGLAAKIANNMLLGITMLGLSEATLLGKRLGVAPQVLADIFNTSTGRCWSSEVNHPDPMVHVGDSPPPAHRDYEGGFVTKLAHKDLKLAMSAAAQAQVNLPLGQRTEEIYRPLAVSQEWCNRDFSSVYKFLEVQNNSTASRI